MKIKTKSKTAIKAVCVCLINMLAIISIFTLQVGSSYASGSSNLPKSYFKMIPAPVKAKSTFCVMHDSGELAMFCDVTLSNKGKLGKFKSATLVHQSSKETVELRFKSRGQKVQIKTSDKTKITYTINPSTKDITVKIKTKDGNGKSLKSTTVDNLNNHGKFWFESIALIDSLRDDMKALLSSEGPLDPYNELSSNRTARTKADSPSTGGLNLGTATSATLSKALWVISKSVSITAGVAAVALGTTAVIAGGSVVSVVAGGLTAILGVAGVAGSFWDIMKDTNPSLESDTADEVFQWTSLTSLSADSAQALTGLLRDGVKATLKSGGPALLLNDYLLAPFFDKQSHKVARGLNLKIIYSWPPAQNDLDTATSLLGSEVGFACNNTSGYLDWTGDDTTGGGSEIVTARISDAASDDALTPTFSVEAKAGWYTGNTGSGQAFLEIYLENPSTGSLYGQRVSKTINPGAQSGCATTPVGGADFTWNSFSRDISWTLR